MAFAGRATTFALASLCSLAFSCSSRDASVKEAPSGIGQTRAPIVGGTTDSADTFVVGIDIGGSALCSGALIAPNLVLTARHCVSNVIETSSGLDCTKANNVSSNFPASAFTITTNQNLSGGPTWGVRKVIYLNDATCSGSVTPECSICGYDLALLELSGSGFPTNTVAPSAKPPGVGISYDAIGYGCETGGGTCGTVGARMLLAGVSAIDVQKLNVTISGGVCSGDSGSPLYSRTENTIYGTLSRGDAPCAHGTYTRLDQYWGWLASHAKTAATDGGYTAPAWTSTPAPSIPAPTGALGTFCVESADCVSDLCLGTGRERCTKYCNTATDCGAGFDCIPAKDATGKTVFDYCWPHPTTPDAGPAPDAAPKEPLGATCTTPADCATNICVNAGGVLKCSATCKAPTDCAPTGFDCLSGYCWPSSAKSDAGPTPVDAAGTGDDAAASGDDSGGGAPTTSSGGCQLGGESGVPPKPIPWVVGVALALPLVRRRKR